MSDYRKVAVEKLPDAPNPTRHKKEVDEAVGIAPASFVAVGAPKDADGSVIEDRCPSCGEVTRWESARKAETVVLACGAETRRFGPGPDDD